MRRARVIACAILAAASVACSSAPAKHVAANEPAASGSSHAATPAGAGAQAQASFSANAQPAGSHAAKPQASASSSSAPFAFPLSGTIRPSCVRPGGSATIEVHTLTGTAVVYDTTYSDGRTGGTPPYGNGLGGNAGGPTDSNGVYRSTWIVSAAAPAGKAYAVVIAGHADKTKEIHVPFAVSNTLGVC